MKGLTLPVRAPSYYGWWIVLTGTGTLAVTTGVSFWAFGLYFEPLEEQFGWSRAQLSGAVSMTWLIGGLLGPLIGRWLDRYGPRSAMLVGAVTTAATYFLLAAMNALWQYYALLFAAAFFRSWIYYLPVNALVSRWFVWRRGQALSIANAGLGLGGFIFTPLIVYLIESLGWRQAYFVSGLIVLAYFVPVTLVVVRNRPEDMGVEEPPLQRPSPVMQSVLDQRSYTLRAALRTPAFWLVAAAASFMYMGQLSFMIHAVPFFRSEGLSSGGAAALMTSVTGLYTALRFVGGVSDRVTPRTLAIVTVLLQALGLALLMVSTAAPALGIFVLLWAMGQANSPVIEPLLISRFFGTAHFGSILGMSGVFSNMGYAMGPLLAGALYDWTGSYDAALVMFITSFLTAASCYVLLAPLGRRQVATA